MASFLSSNRQCESNKIFWPKGILSAITHIYTPVLAWHSPSTRPALAQRSHRAGRASAGFRVCLRQTSEIVLIFKVVKQKSRICPRSVQVQRSYNVCPLKVFEMCVWKQLTRNPRFVQGLSKNEVMQKSRFCPRSVQVQKSSNVCPLEVFQLCVNEHLT